MADIERLFSICDSSGKGFLTEDDLRRICPQLSKMDVKYIFDQLDSDGSGTIEKQEFINGFEDTVLRGERNGFSGIQRRASIVGSPNRTDQINRNEEVFDSDLEAAPSKPGFLFPPDDYQSESDTNMSVDFGLPCQDEVLQLYEQLQNSGMRQMLRKFEKVVGSFYKEIKEKKDENNRLLHVYESEKEMYNRRMEEVESDIDLQLQITESRARQEERERLTKEKEQMREQLEEEMKEMKANIERLQRMEKVLEQEGEKLSHQKELQKRLQEVSSENNELRRSMAENHLELAMIKSELAHVRADYDQKTDELNRQRDEASMSSQENEGAMKQLQLMLDANRKLHETNENLREALESRASVIKQFNLRTPSPMISRETSSPFLATPDLRRPLSQPVFVDDDDTDSGLALGIDDPPTEKPIGDVEMTLRSANGPSERTFRVVMCGDAAVGKSSLVMRLIKGQYIAQLPSTLGVDFHVKAYNIGDHNVAIQLWDTAGQERFRSLCKSYFRRADGAILVYDVTNERSFIRVRDWINTIKDSVERAIPIILVGNKTDLRITHGEGVPTREGASMAAAMGVLFAEASAKDGRNVDGAMLSLARELMAVEDVELRAASVVLTEQPKKTGCFSRCSKS